MPESEYREDQISAAAALKPPATAYSPVTSSLAFSHSSMQLCHCRFQKLAVSAGTAFKKINSAVRNLLQIRNPIQVPQLSPNYHLMAKKAFSMSVVQGIFCHWEIKAAKCKKIFILHYGTQIKFAIDQFIQIKTSSFIKYK